MAVVIETTLGDITVDLYLEQRPVTCLNFLKLCKMKYYNYNLFHSIRSGFIAQTGDPTGEGSGGESIWGILEGPQKRFFSGEKMPKIRHTEAGLLSMVCTGDMMVGSQFFFTLAQDLDSLDGTHCVIGEVTEGHEVLTKLNEVICDESHRPYRDVRITHTVVLEDPFNDPPGLRAPSRSPSPNPERLKGGRIAPDEDIDETEGKTAEEIQEMIEEKEAKARATILEIVGDLPDADIAPPENVLFVCKLNPVTTDDDLEIIFSRFGKIVSCEVIRDKKTGNSLQYAFIEFDNKKSCEDAYFKMDNVLIDDRRIHVDFSQSVSKMRYLGKGRGVQYLDDKSETFDSQSKSKRPPSNDREKNRSRDHSNRNNERRHHRSDKEREHTNDRYHNSRSYRDRSRSRSRLNDSGSHRRNDSKRENRNGDSHRSRNHYNEEQHHKTSSSHRSRDKKNRSSCSPRRKDEKIERRERKDREDEKCKKTDRKNNVKVHESRDVSRNDRKSNKHVEPKTPSPIRDKKNVKNKSKLKNNQESKSKKKRKVSTSSSDSSSETSSSTESSSSSSSESDRKKKRIRRKRRKSSTSSSSSSSSSSSESSSSSTSSNSELDRKKRKKKVQHKKTVKKSKK